MAVVLQDDGDVYADTKAMFDYGFDNFSKVLLSGEEKPEEIRSYADNDSYVLLPDGITFDSLDHEITVEDEKQAAGRITFLYNGQNVGSADVVLTPEYIEEATGYTTRMDLSGSGAALGEDSQSSLLPIQLSTIIRIAAVAAAAVLLLLFVMAIVLRHRAAVRKKRRMMIRRKRHQAQMRHRTSSRQNSQGRRNSSHARQHASADRNRRRG